MTPHYFDLPSTYQLHSSRKFFYWIPEQNAMTRHEAEILCMPEGHVLTEIFPLPRSDEENEDFKKLADGKNFWLSLSSGGLKGEKVDGIWQSIWQYYGYWTLDEFVSHTGKCVENCYTNWRLNDGEPGSASNNKTAAILNASDGKWETAHVENEKHFAICVFRIGETAQTSAPISFPAGTPTSGIDINLR